MSIPLKAKTNEDKNIFKMPKVKNEIKGYTLIKEYFVSKHEYQIEESAINPSNFLKQVKEGLFYGITNEGQFQLYVGEFQKV